MLKIETQQSETIDELTAFRSGWDFYAAQIGPGTESSRVSLYRTKHVLYHRFRCGAAFDQSVRARAGFRSFGLQEMDAPPSWMGDGALPSDGLTVFPASDERGIRGITPSGFSANGIHVSEEYMHRLVEAVYRKPLSAVVPMAGVYIPTHVQLLKVRSELDKWRMLADWEADSRSAIVARREESLVLAILDALVGNQAFQPGKLLKSDHSLGKALELIHDIDLENVAATEICSHAGCSLRTLETVFQKRIGISPKKYIKFLRLARVNQGLKNFDAQDCASIIELAGVHGFWHMGQFAADYRKIYGELPSETQRRGMGSQGT